MGMTTEGATVLQLKRIADALEFIAIKDTSTTVVNNSTTTETSASTLYQLAGNAAGFADELDSILSGSDMFQRAQSLRELQKKARRIANMYSEQAKQASVKDGDKVNSQDEQ